MLIWNKIAKFLEKFRANYVRSAKMLNFEAVVQLHDEIQNYVDKHEVFVFWNKD